MSTDVTDEQKTQRQAFKELYKEIDYSAEYTENFPAILKQLNISLAFTSYQAGRLMLLRSDGKTIDINFNSFHRPMGLAIGENCVTLGTFTQIINFQREDGLLPQLKKPLPKIEQDKTAPKVNRSQHEEDDAEKALIELLEELVPEDEELRKHAEKLRQWQDFQESQYRSVEQQVDACFVTRSSHYSGMINIHDIAWGTEGLWAVNSSFSCLCTLEPGFSFTPRWKPYFISDLVAEDRCHLNGMALKDGKPAYVTTFSKEDIAANWRTKSDDFDGTLMCVESNRVLLDGLCMPHSPRWYKNKVYYCNSGEGEVCSYDPETGKQQVIAQVPGFTRGVDFFGSLMFVGLSKVRKSDITRPAPLAERCPENCSGIYVIDMEKERVIARLTFSGNVDQIYDVGVLPGCSFPELIGPEHPRMRNHFSFPGIQS